MIMADGIFQEFEGDRIAISYQGVVAVLKRHENCIFLYGKEATDIPEEQWVTRKLNRNIFKPYDVCFAPNNHLVVSDIGDKSVKIFTLEGDQEQINQFVIGYNATRSLIVQDVIDIKKELSSGIQLNFETVRVPHNIVVGRGPLFQLFVTCEAEIIFINMDWNKRSLINYFPISSPMDWYFVQCEKKLVCDEASTVRDHKDNHKVGGFNPLLITRAQFCGMFYHVSETNHAGFLCLDRSECKIGKRGDKKKFAETVVIYVRLTDKDGRLIFHARYGNCYEGPNANTAHAEYFMLIDEEFRQAVKFLQDIKGGNINMYMNKQPCYKSTGHGKKTELKIKNCAQELLNFFHFHCLFSSIKLKIYLCQLYKVGKIVQSPLLLQEKGSLGQDIWNAQLGLKILLSQFHIELKAMTQETWETLANYAEIKLPDYQGSERQKLDLHIHNLLLEMKKLPISQLLGVV